MIPIKDPSEIVKLDLPILYGVAQIMHESDEIPTEEYDQKMPLIENGIKINLPLIYIINRYYKVFPSSKRVLVYGFGKINLIKFEREKQERENLLKQLILNNLGDDSPTDYRQNI